MPDEVGVHVKSRNPPCWIDGVGGGAISRARDIQDRRGAVPIPQEAVRYKVGVGEEPSDHTGRVDADRDGALASPCASTQDVERSDGAIGSPQRRG